MNTSLKNHMYGCSSCEFCGSKNLDREQSPITKLTSWTCKDCKAEHYWAWDNIN